MLLTLARALDAKVQHVVLSAQPSLDLSAEINALSREKAQLESEINQYKTTDQATYWSIGQRIDKIAALIAQKRKQLRDQLCAPRAPP
jgi:septal ring factor EnvC (AmiA/AmiB activator)